MGFQALVCSKQACVRRNGLLIRVEVASSLDISYLSKLTATSARSMAAKSSLWSSDDQAYWETYLSARPKYSSAFYDRIFAYHFEHANDSPDVAVDVGAGPGQVAQILATRFRHVIVNDPSESHLQAARARLVEMDSDGRASFVACKGEDVHEHVEAESVDFVAAAECIPLMDPVAALEAFARILKPGGTMAVWFYGRPQFVADDERGEWDEACNAAYGRVAGKAYGELGRKMLASPDAGVKRAAERARGVMESRLENIEVPGNSWEDVRRTSWNGDCKEFAFFGVGPAVDGRKMASKVGKHEKVEEIRDRSFWAEQWGVEEAKRFIAVNVPSFDPETLEKDEYLPLLQELEDAIGGRGATKQVTWPVVLIMATKKQ